MGCKKCSYTEYTVINSNRIKDDRYGLITVELRQCNKCFHRYRVASNGQQEFYYD